jgi:hypothetical protein
MRTLLIACFAVVIQLQHAVPKKTYQVKANQDGTSNGVKPSVPESKGAVAGPSPHKEQNGAKDEANKANWVESIRAPVLNNWAVLAVTMWGIIILIKQTRATRKAAEAAEKSAEFIVNAEKAWILVTCTPFLPVGTEPGDLEPGGKPRAIRIPLKVMNYGKSPGWITSMAYEMTVVSAESDLPQEPKYAERQLAGDERILAPDSVIRIEDLIALRDEFVSVNAKEKGMYVYGRIIYRDIFRQERETRFCYLYRPPSSVSAVPNGFFVGGPKGYNIQT